MMMTIPSIGVVFITHCAKKHLPFCLPPILNSPLKPRVLVVNSSSEDGTLELAKAMGAETLLIPRSTFNHGTTRETARHILKTDIVVMMTPDAYALNEEMVGKLIDPILRGEAAVSYARQLPHKQADFFESFPRAFNYPAKSQLRTIKDLSTYGVYTIFCSNSCAAYRNSCLDEIGGFQPVLTGEDTLAVAALLRKGHSIAYVAEACVRHSHRYTLKEEFKRHFDTGLARKTYRQMINLGGTDSARGYAYVKTMLKQLWKEKPRLLPYACLQIGVKWMGYQLGAWSIKAPIRWKRWCSAQDFYWTKKDRP